MAEKDYLKGAFVIHYQDGTIFDERNDGYWDDAPDKGIIELHYVLGNRIEVIKDCDSYFFSNEAIHGPSLSGKVGIWTAGIIGGIRDGLAIQKRIRADGVVEDRTFPASRLGFIKETYRKGMREDR